MSTLPVLLLHGWGGTFESTFRATGWCATLKEQGRSLIEMDLPGHGGGLQPTRPHDYCDLAGAVELQLPERPLDVVGYSLGAKIALELACRNPGRFRRVVLGGVGDNLFAPERNGEALADVLERGNARGASSVVQALMRYALEPGNDPRAMAAVLRRPPNPILDAGRLGTIRTPVLLVNGDRDALALPDDQLRSALPSAKYVLLAGVDHLSLPAQEEFRKKATAFIGETMDPGAPMRRAS